MERACLCRCLNQRRILVVRRSSILIILQNFLAGSSCLCKSIGSIINQVLANQDMLFASLENILLLEKFCHRPEKDICFYVNINNQFVQLCGFVDIKVFF